MKIEVKQETIIELKLTVKEFNYITLALGEVSQGDIRQVAKETDVDIGDVNNTIYYDFSDFRENQIT